MVVHLQAMPMPTKWATSCTGRVPWRMVDSTSCYAHGYPQKMGTVAQLVDRAPAPARTLAHLQRPIRRMQHRAFPLTVNGWRRDPTKERES